VSSILLLLKEITRVDTYEGKSSVLATKACRKKRDVAPVTFNFSTGHLHSLATLALEIENPVPIE
jgi:hypothetical protein